MQLCQKGPDLQISSKSPTILHPSSKLEKRFESGFLSLILYFERTLWIERQSEQEPWPRRRSPLAHQRQRSQLGRDLPNRELRYLRSRWFRSFMTRQSSRWSSTARPSWNALRLDLSRHSCCVCVVDVSRSHDDTSDFDCADDHRTGQWLRVRT